MEALLSTLAVGGDIGVWVIVYIAWRIDKRVTWCEMKLGKEGA